MKKLVIFTNSDSHFYAHLLPIALAAKANNYQVKILTNVSDFQNKIQKYDIQVIPLSINRSSINPFREFMLLLRVIRIIKTEKPDILNNFTLKPIIYGSIAALFAKVPKIINTFLGMGTIFISNNLLIKLLKVFICLLLKISYNFKNMLFIVQNNDDKKLLIELNIARENDIVVQCSVGVKTEEFPELPEPKGKIIFALVARMIADKGINEFIIASKLLKEKGIEAEFWLVGEPDKQNRTSISLDKLQYYHQQGYVRYLGFQTNIKKIWQQAHVAVLPSYREGLSHALLEAGAYGRAIITTDAPGGRELIKDKNNGLLVKVKDYKSLANAMELLVVDNSLRKKLGNQIRQDIANLYDTAIIQNKMISFYKV